MDEQTLLTDGLLAMGLHLSDAQQKQLLAYVHLLMKWNSTYNLTALREADRIISHHVLDSLSILPFIQDGKTLLDVGSGGGTPGILVAIARPNVSITLMDSNSKKTAFLRQAIVELGLDAEVITGRVESLQNRSFDYITARAFAELSDFTQLTRHLLAPQGSWVAMKGVYPYEELAQLSDDIEVKGVETVAVPQIDAQRHIVLMSMKKA